MDTKARRAILRWQLLRPGMRVIAAVSGGADSVAMLHFLRVFCAEQKICLYAAHLNHGLRENAEQDESFVRGLCEKAGVPLFVCHARLGEQGLCSEDDARKARYAFFDRLASDYGALVATAHTANDNAETVLFRLARGSSIAGAAGILPKRGVFIRPLLLATRADVESYCAAHSLRYVTDETNETDAYARNRIRHTALPALLTANSGAVENLSAFAQEMGELAEYVSAQAELLLCGTDGAVSAEKLRAAPETVRRSALAKLAGAYLPVDKRVIFGCEDALFGRVHKYELTRGCYAACRSGRFVLWKEEKNTLQIPFSEGVCDAFSGWHIEVFVCDMSEMIKICKQDKKQLKNFADYDMITNNPVFRTRRSGDRFCPAIPEKEKSVSKLLSKQKLPLPERDHLPVLAQESRVLWLCGFGVSAELRPTEGSHRVYFIHTDQTISSSFRGNF